MMTKKTNGRIFTICSLVLVWSFISVAVAQADRNYFRDHDDDVTINEGTVYDEKTGLTWHQDGTDGRYTWQEALAYVDSLNAGAGYGGCRGWVLPTSKELDRLVDHSRHSGSARIDTDYFQSTKNDYYWSSSSHKNSLKYATSFGNGHKRKRSSSNKYYVRARRGQCDPTDNDGDGYLPAVDCNDNDPNINPGAVERCDGYVDNNCDVDYDLTCWDVDNDLDGQTENEGDCDDRDPNNFSGNTEVCDGMDNDCDTVADNGLIFDTDGDGYYAIGSCGDIGDDCNDTNPAINPGAAEICGDLVDQDCTDGDLSCLDVDNDGDGQTENGGDCDDTDPANFSGNAELCDAADNDCDTVADNGLAFTTYYQDSDNDSYGNAADFRSTCDGAPSGYVTDNTDCDDVVSAVNPAAAEICDNVDNNCDGSIDENLTQATSCGEGECGSSGIETCTAGSWGGDTCVAGTPSAETCDNLDNNCDGSIDENLTQATSCGVGACAGNTGEETCTAGVWGGDTCDPLAGATAEICDDGIDQNCDGGDDVCLSSPVKIGTGQTYTSIQVAYDDIPLASAETIYMQDVVFGDILFLDRDVNVTLRGGYDSSYSEPSTGQTVISVPGGVALMISYGSVIIENIILQ